MYKFNNGNGAHVCDECLVIIKTGVPPTSKKHKCNYCSTQPTIAKKHRFNRNYYGIDLELTCKKYAAAGLKGNKVKYINDFAINGYHYPCAIFHCTKPDTSLGHTEYFGLFLRGSQMFITGFTKEYLKDFALPDGIQCNDCKSTIYSSGRHCMVSCNCGAVSIDGGDSYSRVGMNGGSGFTEVILDLFANKVYPVKVKSVRKKKK